MNNSISWYHASASDDRGSWLGNLAIRADSSEHARELAMQHGYNVRRDVSVYRIDDAAAKHAWRRVPS